MELAKAYDPQDAQKKWLAHWDEKGYFHAEPDPSKTPYSIVIPPPNVTGALHLGHALNNTLQDVLIRYHRAKGDNTMWMPGTDHAGIATQAVVERLVQQTEKKTRHDLGREELVKRIWQWKDKYESRILGQLKQIGASCDWKRTRFTLDEICARAVRQTFFNMFKDGYIFRGKRLVNWDTHLQTSVADDETYTDDIQGSFWTFKYPVQGSDEFIRFSTTRPETMLGDTAVCVHPSDDRYKHLVGKKVLIPLVNREIPIIADALLADPDLGTGCVKVTPAHDPNDYACYTRHPEIGIINILNPDGTLNAEAGEYAKMDRYKAREAVVLAMETLGLFEGKEDRTIPMKYSDRSKTPIEPYLSDQWFVRMRDGDDGKKGLAQISMDAVTDGRVKIFPERYTRSYLDWLGEKRDWCISRQLWWGHRIPVWRASLAFIPAGDVEELALTTSKEAIEELSTYLVQAGVPKDDVAFHYNDADYCLYCCAGSERCEKALHAIEGPQGGKRIAMERAFRLRGSDDPMQTFMTILSEDVERPTNLLMTVTQLSQEDDVLDTWFSSALWPHSTLGWPEQTPSLKQWYPTSLLVTSRDIITLWVARMVLTGLYNLNEIPFHHVYVHPKLLDGFGETMSKSKGNGIDPLDIIDRYGADALRFTMTHLATDNQDNRMPVANVCPHCDHLVPVKQEHMYMRTKKVACPDCKQPFRPGGPWPLDDPDLKTAKQASERFEMGRNFANKIWNAARFLLMNLDGYTPAPLASGQLPIEDRWILSRLATTTAAITRELDAYHFSEVARLLYDFVWTEFCDWYVEMAKGRLKTDRAAVQRVLVNTLDAICRLVQPVMPFVAESIWAALNEAAPVRGLKPETAKDSVVIAPWPTFDRQWTDATTETRIGRMQELIRSVREIRNRYKIDPKTPLTLAVRCTKAVADDLGELSSFITQLAGVGALTTGPDTAKPPQSAGHVTADFEAYVSLVGLINVEAELKRLDKEIADKKKSHAATLAKLSNAAFTSKAPAEVIAQQKTFVEDLTKQIAALEANAESLRSA